MALKSSMLMRHSDCNIIYTGSTFHVIRDLKKVNVVLLLHKFLVLIVDEYNLRDIHYFWSGFESKEKSATIT